MLTFLKKKRVFIIIIAAVLVGSYLIFFKKGTVTNYAVATAARGTIVSYVSGTGQVSGRSQVNITPLASGKVVSVDVAQGDYVKAGQTIAVLDESPASSSVAQAKASLASAQANYEKLLGGPTAFQIKASQLSVKGAQDALNNAYQNLDNNLNSIFTSVFNTVRGATDLLFSNPNTFSPTLLYSTNDVQSGINAQNGRVSVNNELANWQAELQGLHSSPSTSSLAAEAQQSLAHLSVVENFLNSAEDSLVNAISSPSFTAANINSYKSNVSGALSSVQGSISSLTSDIQQIQSSRNSLATAENSLAQLQSPPTNADVKSAEAQVLNAEAQLQSAETNYENNIIRAPFAGEVAILNIQAGDLITGSTVAGTTGSTEIGTIVAKQKIAEISLNETDVATMKIGDKATVTFDALPDLSVAGRVAEIDNVGTVTQGVVNYNVKITFDSQDPRIKSGMSVTANVVTAVHQNVLMIPTSAVKTQGNASIVQKLDKNTLAPSTTNTSLYTSSALPVNVVVQIGIADDVNTEITNGLKEGDVIVTQVIGSTGSIGSQMSGNAGGIRFGGGGGGVLRGFGG